MAWYRWQADTLILTLKVQPRARQDSVDGLHNGALKVRITAPPVDDKANEALCRWLAEDFGAPRAAVTVLRGATSRSKVVEVAKPTVAPSWFRELGGEWVGAGA